MRGGKERKKKKKKRTTMAKGAMNREKSVVYHPNRNRSNSKGPEKDGGPGGVISNEKGSERNFVEEKN